MKKFILVIGILILSGVMVFVSCKKDNKEETPVDNTPVLSFMTGAGYISSNATLEVNMVFKLGVQGSKNPNTNIDIATFKVERNFNGIIEIVHENNEVGESSLSWESNEVTNSTLGGEIWTFTITDYSGLKKELSFVITTLGQGALSPEIVFMVGADFVSGDTSLDVGSDFTVGVNASANPNTNKDLESFKVVRTFNNIPTTVFEESNIASNSYSWQGDVSANNDAGAENWTFSILDQSGKVNELSFTIATMGGAPYLPNFSPTYLVVNQGGIDVLDFYITCTTDDWEMIKVIVTYPGGLGSETYIGNGTIMTVGAPFTFSNYFPKLLGTWTFAITGNIKSGVHVGESFTVVVPLTVIRGQ